jgi:predicted dehydrogenase
MAKTYRVGVASMVHDHVWGELNHWTKLPNVELVAAGDVNADLRERIQSKFNVPKVYDSWQELIANEELDIVQAASENSVAADIVEACAAKGIHVISEKPMSATLDQANRMVRATEAAGTQLMINWPTAWNPAIQEMERRILAGYIGQLFISSSVARITAQRKSAAIRISGAGCMTKRKTAPAPSWITAGTQRICARVFWGCHSK